jgi:hypothetical protein
MMKFVNPTSNVINLTPIGLGKIEPGAAVLVEEHLYRPERTAGGGRGKSVIEQVAPQMIPVADQGWIDAWKSAPTPPKPVSRVVTSDTLHQLPQAILEARKAFEEAAAMRAAGQEITEAPAPVPETAPEAPAEPVAAPAEVPPPVPAAAPTPAPKRRGRPPKAKPMDPDVAASNPGVTSGIMDDGE